MLDVSHRISDFDPIPMFSCSVTLAACSREIVLISVNRDLQEVVKTALTLTTDWTIFQAYTYSEGFALAQTRFPDAVLFDVDSREGIGELVLEELHRRLKLKGIPLILMCDRVRLGDWQRCLKQGMQGLISKPFDAVKLGHQIASFLAKPVE